MRASRRSGFGPRAWVLLGIAAAGLWAGVDLGLGPEGLIPSAGGFEVAKRLVLAAVSPALDYESGSVPEGAPPLLLETLGAAWRTVLFAAAAMSLALIGGLALGFFASTAWWSGRRTGGANRLRRLLDRGVAPVVYGATRVIIALLRAVHELIWAVLFLCAFGRSELTAAIAIAIPYAGTLAKVFSELIDEAPRDAARAIAGTGATPTMTFCFGLLPRALPDMTAYTFYRFECALRSAAILGYFGYPTLGLMIKLAYENTHYRELWTHLYALFALIVLFEAWSGALRRRLVR